MNVRKYAPKKTKLPTSCPSFGLEYIKKNNILKNTTTARLSKSIVASCFFTISTLSFFLSNPAMIEKSFCAVVWRNTKWINTESETRTPGISTTGNISILPRKARMKCVIINTIEAIKSAVRYGAVSFDFFRSKLSPFIRDDKSTSKSLARALSVSTSGVAIPVSLS